MVKATKKPRITHEAAAIFGLGGGITKEDAEITGIWLPTNKQVITRCFTDKKELPKQNKKRLYQNCPRTFPWYQQKEVVRKSLKS